MSEEIFDVVDANDQIIDQQPRSEVHRLGLKHRAIHLLVGWGLYVPLKEDRYTMKDT